MDRMFEIYGNNAWLLIALALFVIALIITAMFWQDIADAFYDLFLRRRE